MRAVTWHGTEDVRVDTVPDPTIQDPTDAIVRVTSTAICGSDLHYYNHGGFGAIRLKEPMILGHEVSGHVSALGEGVSNLAVGDLVAVSPSRPCRACQYCQRWRPICRSPGPIAIGSASRGESVR